MPLDPDAADLTLDFHQDPAPFLAAAESHLAADPVLTTVVSSVTHRAMADAAAGVSAPEHPCWWVVVRQADGIVGVAMRTAPFAPYPLFVLPMPDAAARLIATTLIVRGEPVSAVNGALPAAQKLANELARHAGGTASVHQHMRLFELGDLVEPAPVPGRLRLAGVEDVELAREWFTAFGADAAEQAGRVEEAAAGEHIDREDMARRIEDERVWLWEDQDGGIVHLTGHSLPSFGVARVGPVYTPARHRGRGYASAGVAAVSRRLVSEGARVCLFTDQANPTSNKIYQALGFRAVVDMANLVITTPAPA